MNSKTQTGTVKFFNKTKGFGFIINDDAQGETFVHIKDCDAGYMPEKDDKVEFSTQETPKGIAAKSVTKI